MDELEQAELFANLPWNDAFNRTGWPNYTFNLPQKYAKDWAYIGQIVIKFALDLANNWAYK